VGRDDSGHPTRDVSLEKEAAKYGNAPGHGLPYVSANLPNDQELKRDPVLAAESGPAVGPIHFLPASSRKAVEDTLIQNKPSLSFQLS
jgi:hypothetical protein